MTKRVYSQPSGAHSPCCYRASFGRSWFVQVYVPVALRPIPERRSIYLGSYETMEQAAAAVREFKSSMGMDLAPIPKPLERPQQRW